MRSDNCLNPLYSLTSFPWEQNMGINEIKSYYSLMFKEYPDVVNVEQLCSMLGGLSEKTVYKLLKEGII